VVKGLDRFREHFAAHTHQYTLIGGTAATLTMEAAGLEFRATKDFDIVLHVESLDAAFGRAFWAFVEQGGYALRQRAEDSPPLRYRFQRPRDPSFPFMLELFGRSPRRILLPEGARLTPMPVGEAVASLSAILMNDAYYDFVLAGRVYRDGLPHISHDRLIPLKARAWLDLAQRRLDGHAIDASDVRKHAKDVIRLAQLLVPGIRFDMPSGIATDLRAFRAALSSEASVNPRELGIARDLETVLRQIDDAYGL
jgi:hypothetical protein